MANKISFIYIKQFLIIHSNKKIFFFKSTKTQHQLSYVTFLGFYYY